MGVDVESQRAGVRRAESELRWLVFRPVLKAEVEMAGGENERTLAPEIGTAGDHKKNCSDRKHGMRDETGENQQKGRESCGQEYPSCDESCSHPAFSFADRMQEFRVRF